MSWFRDQKAPAQIPLVMTTPLLVQTLTRLLAGQIRADNSLTGLTQKVDQLMLNVTALTAQVAQNSSVMGSALVLIQGFKASQAALSQQLADAVAANDPVALAAVQKTIDDSVSQLAASDTGLAAAVAENTSVAEAAQQPA